MEIKHFKSFLLFITVLFINGEVLAQANAAIVTGMVRDESGESLANVSVIARNESTGLTSGAQTDTNGVFKFAVLPVEGKYSFSFSIVGYESQNLSGYVLKTNQVTNIMVKLRSISATLSDVVVIGYGIQKKSSLTGAVTSISTKQMQKQTA
ncbi:MAG TPA: carboxypeptidase regulatory-like domain-containing protein, partial [Flavisolibacter sp.]|nr:carboxypeptidase regulatory-like domain-containing protein [Flavisolibacter sp.]